MLPDNPEHGAFSLGSGHPRSALFVVIFVCLLFCAPAASAASEEAKLTEAMQHMLTVISGYGMKDPEVLEAMGRVPRHEFVPDKNRRYSYQDTPLAIGLP